MKVLHAVPGDSVGGVVFQVATVADELDGRGVENVVVTPSGEVELPAFVDEDAVRARRGGYRLPTFFDDLGSVGENLLWGVNAVASVRHLRRVLAEEDPDVVHVYGLLLVQPGVAAALAGYDVVWYLVSDIYPSWALWGAMPLIDRLATEKMVISDTNYDYYFPDGRWDHGDVTVVPGTIPTDYYEPDAVERTDVEALRSAVGVGDEPVVATVSKVNPVKGQRRVVEAISRLDCDCTYLIAGPTSDEEYAASIERAVERAGLVDRVHLLGFVDDKRTVLDLADVFVLPSSGEGTPLCIMEALSMETPVVATDVGGIPEMLGPEDVGQLVPPGSIEELAAAIERYTADEDRRRDHAERGRRFVAETYGAPKIATRHEEIYARVGN